MTPAKSETCTFTSAARALELTPCATHLDLISVSNGGPESQGSRRRTKQRHSQGCGQAEAANVAKREAAALPEPGGNRARQAGAAPEAVAACRSAQRAGWLVLPLGRTRPCPPSLHVLESSKQSHKLVCQSVHASAAIISCWSLRRSAQKRRPRSMQTSLRVVRLEGSSVERRLGRLWSHR